MRGIFRVGFFHGVNDEYAYWTERSLERRRFPDIEKQLANLRYRPNSAEARELIAKLINQGNDLVDGIEKMFAVIEGSCSLLLLNRSGIYVARDRFGYTPFVVGRSANAWAVTSESSAFPNLGFEGADGSLHPRHGSHLV